MPSAPYHLSISATRAGALFASPPRRSDEPSASQVRRAIATAIGVYGVRGCAARVAQAHGEHPETALTRMRWALTAAASASGGSPAAQAHPPAPGHSTMTCTPAPHEPPPRGFPRPAARPLTATGPGANAPATHTAVRIPHRCPPAARVHHPDMRTEYRNPDDWTRTTVMHGVSY